MSALSKKTNIILTIIIAVIAPVVFGVILNASISVNFVSIPLHSVLETSGGVIAIIISLIFYIKYSTNLTLTHFNYASFALLAMGIIDIFHASVMPGESFVWLHSTAVFFGGVFFLSVWIEQKKVSQKIYNFLPTLSIVFAILFSLISIEYPELFIRMLNEDKTFTNGANYLNFIGGVCFFIAALKFSINYIKTNKTDELLFAGTTMLFGVAGILFTSSMLWDAQ